MIGSDGPDLLRLQVEENLSGVVPPPDPTKYLDYVAYWDHIHGELVGVIRGTAILHKQPGEPWMITMQQIVGSAGHEVVRQSFSRPLKSY